MTYSSSIWGGSIKTYLNDNTIAQKKLIRIMFHKQRYARTNPLFDQYKLLKFQDIVYLQTCLFVYKALHIYPIGNDYIYISPTILIPEGPEISDSHNAGQHMHNKTSF